MEGNLSFKLVSKNEWFNAWWGRSQQTVEVEWKPSLVIMSTIYTRILLRQNMHYAKVKFSSCCKASEIWRMVEAWTCKLWLLKPMKIFIASKQLFSEITLCSLDYDKWQSLFVSHATQPREHPHQPKYYSHP